MAHTKHKVLFPCTGNSCRSQMAEATVNTRLSADWQAFSAGVKLTMFIHPLAIRVLAEIGISYEGRSRSVDEFRNQSFDVVITLCDDAAESCPLWLGKGKRVQMGFPDPVKAEGPEEEASSVFREVRDDIAVQVVGFLRRYPQY
jgi:arsenate reductase